jgi:hypothetical protein
MCHARRFRAGRMVQRSTKTTWQLWLRFTERTGVGYGMVRGTLHVAYMRRSRPSVLRVRMNNRQLRTRGIFAIESTPEVLHEIPVYPVRRHIDVSNVAVRGYQVKSAPSLRRELQLVNPALWLRFSRRNDDWPRSSWADRILSCLCGNHTRYTSSVLPIRPLSNFVAPNRHFRPCFGSFSGSRIYTSAADGAR